jgi:hypothetical protein
VRGDAYHSQDSEDSGREDQFDPIWSARARVDGEGWDRRNAHPLLAAPLQRRAGADVGLELTRNVADKSERIQWVMIPVSAAGFSSTSAARRHRGIPATRRLELLPYVATDLTYARTWMRAIRTTTSSGARAAVISSTGSART